jgi:RES domain-containing protein
MEIWRICLQKHELTAFSGDDGLYAAGRWHPKGLPIIYTASSLALATLELLVPLESSQIPLVAIRVIIPDDLEIETVDRNILPANWQEIAAYPQLQEIGKKWLEGHKTPILKVPSSIVPVEFNYLLNPAHSDFRVELDPPLTLSFTQGKWQEIKTETEIFRQSLQRMLSLSDLEIFRQSLQGILTLTDLETFRQSLQNILENLKDSQLYSFNQSFDQFLLRHQASMGSDTENMVLKIKVKLTRESDLICEKLIKNVERLYVKLDKISNPESREEAIQLLEEFIIDFAKSYNELIEDLKDSLHSEQW